MARKKRRRNYHKVRMEMNGLWWRGTDATIDRHGRPDHRYPTTTFPTFWLVDGSVDSPDAPMKSLGLANRRRRRRKIERSDQIPSVGKTTQKSKRGQQPNTRWKARRRRRWWWRRWRREKPPSEPPGAPPSARWKMVHFVMTGRQQQPPRSSRTAAKKKNSVKLGKTKSDRVTPNARPTVSTR